MTTNIPSTKLITCISIERSGTNHILNNLLHKFANMNVNKELYNEAVGCTYKIRINTKYYLPEFETSSPIDIINILMKNSSEKYVIHKIFANHFKYNNYNNTQKYDFNNKLYENKYNNLLLKSSAICFIKRNLLDMYISLEKTKITNQWHNYNSTNIKIIFNIEEFIKYKNNILAWFKMSKQNCIKLGKPIIVLDYDELNQLSEEDQLKYCKSKFTDSLNDDFQYNINLISRTKKQDLSANYCDKISNYDDVNEFINNKNNFINNEC